MDIVPEILIERINLNAEQISVDKELRKQAVIYYWLHYGKKIKKLEKRYAKKEYVIYYLDLIRLYGQLRYVYEAGVIFRKNDGIPMAHEDVKKDCQFLLGLWKESKERLQEKNKK